MTKQNPPAPRDALKSRSRIDQQVARLASMVEGRARGALTLLNRGGMLGDSARLAMAKNLHGIVNDAEKRGTLKKKIAETARMVDASGKSGRFHDYMVDPALSEEDQKRRIKRLVKNVSGYLQIAEAAAKLAGLDMKETILRLVSGTKFEPGMEDLANDVVPEHFEMLARIIEAEGKRITESTKLDWYFHTIDNQGLSPNGDNWEADDQAWLWTHMTLPSIVLFTEEVACFGGTWWEGDSKTGVLKLVRVCRQVRLVLAPFGEGKAVRPYFVLRPVLLISNGPRKAASTEDLLNMDLSYPRVTGMPDPEGVIYTRFGTLKVHDAKAVRETALCPASDLPGDDHEFIPVTPATIRQVLESGLSVEHWIDGNALSRPAGAFTKSPPGTLTAALERALLYGADMDSPETRLMSELEKKAADYVDGLRRFVDQALSDIESRAEKLIHG